MSKKTGLGPNGSAVVEKSVRSISGLRETLFQTLDELRAGACEPHKAKAVMYVAQVILNTVDLQMRVERFQAPRELDQLPDVPLEARVGARRGIPRAQKLS
jgi:hypothetical protein